MAKLKEKEATTTPRAKLPVKTAFREKDYETLFVVFIFLLSLLATLWMVFISVTDPVPDNRFRIVPAASIMVMTEVWLLVYLPVYGKLAFWGALITLATFLFFALPFLLLGLLPAGWSVVTGIFCVLSLVCFGLLFRQRDRFLSR